MWQSERQKGSFFSTFGEKRAVGRGECWFFIIVFHSQTDGQSERLIQVLEDMLQGCVMKISGSWDRYIPLMEISYRNSYQVSIAMAPYEALYDRRCRTPRLLDGVE